MSIDYLNASALHRQKGGFILFVFSVIVGLCIAVSPCISHAADTQNDSQAPAEKPNTIVIDVAHQQYGTDNEQLDQFNQAQLEQYHKMHEGSKVQYAAVDGDNVVLSETPLKHVYMPSELADLRVSYYLHEAGNSAIVKMTPYALLADSHIQQLPRIPVFVKERITYTKFEIFLQKIQRTLQANKLKITAAYHRISPSSLVIGKDILQMLACMIVILLAGNMIFQWSRKSSRRNKVSYTGKLGAANALVGEGRLFNFNGKTVNSKHLLANSSYSNLIWSIKKFTHQGSGQTYFYITFYIPSLQGYATPLQKSKASSTRKYTIEA